MAVTEPRALPSEPAPTGTSVNPSTSSVPRASCARMINKWAKHAIEKKQVADLDLSPTPLRRRLSGVLASSLSVLDEKVMAVARTPALTPVLP